MGNAEGLPTPLADTPALCAVADARQRNARPEERVGSMLQKGMCQIIEIEMAELEQLFAKFAQRFSKRTRSLT